MDRFKGDRSDSDSGTPRDDRFFTPRLSARLGGSSSDGESWATPRSTVGPGWLSDEGEYATPREFAVSHTQQEPGNYYPRTDDTRTRSYQQYLDPRHQANSQYPQPQSSSHMAAQSALPNSWQAATPQYAEYKNTGYDMHQQQQYPQQQHQLYHHEEHPNSHEYWEEYPINEVPDEAEAKDSADGGDLHQAIDDIFSYARHNRVEEVERLLDRGVPVNVRDQFGNTILTISCQNGNKRVAKAALRRGADINAQNLKGNTALHFCYAYGYGDTLGQYLVNKGADPSIRNNAGFSGAEGPRARS